jgi:hypothetical protein
MLSHCVIPMAVNGPNEGQWDFDTLLAAYWVSKLWQRATREYIERTWPTEINIIGMSDDHLALFGHIKAAKALPSYIASMKSLNELRGAGLANMRALERLEVANLSSIRLPIGLNLQQIKLVDMIVFGHNIRALNSIKHVILEDIYTTSSAIIKLSGPTVIEIIRCIGFVHSLRCQPAATDLYLANSGFDGNIDLDLPYFRDIAKATRLHIRPNWYMTRQIIKKIGAIAWE